MRPKVKYAVINCHRTEYPVSVMCKFFGVFRSGYYDFVKRIGQPEQDTQLARNPARRQYCRRYVRHHRGDPLQRSALHYRPHHPRSGGHQPCGHGPDSQAHRHHRCRLMKTDGAIDKVYINGNASFKEGDTFQYDVEVVVEYYSPLFAK